MGMGWRIGNEERRWKEHDYKMKELQDYTMKELQDCIVSRVPMVP